MFLTAENKLLQENSFLLVSLVILCVNFGLSTCQRVNNLGSQFLPLEALRKCFPWDEPGDCGKNMIYYQHPMKGCESLGFCDCDMGYHDNNPYSCRNYPIRMRVYVPEAKQCFPVFSQANCRPREVLIFDEQLLEPRCVRNRCFPRGFRSNSTSNQFWFFDIERNQCYQSLTQGYCSNGETLEITHDSQYPKCQKRVCPYGALSIRSPLACRRGTRFSSYLGGCRVAPKSNAKFRSQIG